ncbi:gliding motility-associated C-terminal domain-containing protein [Bacteriovoracaceae bacterium]|nr:gliding motility-associated C-terminal domain-containing protein [Bacteriovoracaceae bacterium]
MARAFPFAILIFLLINLGLLAQEDEINLVQNSQMWLAGVDLTQDPNTSLSPFTYCPTAWNQFSYGLPFINYGNSNWEIMRIPPWNGTHSEFGIMQNLADQIGCTQGNMTLPNPTQFSGVTPFPSMAATDPNGDMNAIAALWAMNGNTYSGSRSEYLNGKLTQDLVPFIRYKVAFDYALARASRVGYRRLHALFYDDLGGTVNHSIHPNAMFSGSYGNLGNSGFYLNSDESFWLNNEGAGLLRFEKPHGEGPWGMAIKNAQDNYETTWERVELNSDEFYRPQSHQQNTLTMGFFYQHVQSVGFQRITWDLDEPDSFSASTDFGLESSNPPDSNYNFSTFNFYDNVSVHCHSNPMFWASKNSQQPINFPYDEVKQVKLSCGDELRIKPLLKYEDDFGNFKEFYFELFNPDYDSLKKFSHQGSHTSIFPLMSDNELESDSVNLSKEFNLYSYLKNEFGQENISGKEYLISMSTTCHDTKLDESWSEIAEEDFLKVSIDPFDPSLVQFELDQGSYGIDFRKHSATHFQINPGNFKQQQHQMFEQHGIVARIKGTEQLSNYQVTWEVYKVYPDNTTSLVGSPIIKVDDNEFRVGLEEHSSGSNFDIILGLSSFYKITAKVKTIHDCMEEKTFEFSVDVVESFFVPNAFSPNRNGVNDLFEVYFKNPSQIDLTYFRLFNRWGALVYECAGNNPTHCQWNGKFKNEDAAVGVYAWIISFKAGNGREVNDSGDLTLLR